MTRTRLRPFALALLAALALGCAAKTPDPAALERLAKTPYPKDAPRGEDFDIVVTHKGGGIRLDNRTPRAYEHLQLWLNQQYVRSIPLIKVGNAAPENRLDLKGFLNTRGDRFPVGGLLTPDKGAPVVLAELFDPSAGKRHRLLVRPAK